MIDHMINISCPIIWRLFVMDEYFEIMGQCDTEIDLIINVGHSDWKFMVQWFCIISWRMSHGGMPYFGITCQCDGMIDLMINVGLSWLSFMVQWFCLIILHWSPVIRLLVFFRTKKSWVLSDPGHLHCPVWQLLKDRQSLVTRKPVFQVCDQVRLKPACAATATTYSLQIAAIACRHIILSRQRTTKMLIRLRRCAGWSAPLLFAYGIIMFSHDVAQAGLGHECVDLEDQSHQRPFCLPFHLRLLDCVLYGKTKLFLV